MNIPRQLFRRALPALALWLLFTGSAAATGPLPSFEARYNIRGFGFQIGLFNSTLSESAGGGYRYDTETRTTGFIANFNKDVIRERSNWIWHKAMIRPLNYTYQRSGGQKTARPS